MNKITTNAVNAFGLVACVSTIIYALHVEHMLPALSTLA